MKNIDRETIVNEVDEEWLTAIAKQWVRRFGKEFETLDGETREEGLEHNVSKVFEEIDELRAELSATTKRADTCDQIIDQRLAEIAGLQKELTALKTLANLPPDYCLSCGGDGGHLEGCQGTTGLMSVLTELNEANARISYLTIANEKLHKELAALKTPPRCPKCGSGEVQLFHGYNVNELYHEVQCAQCGEVRGHGSLDAALNAWRKGETK